MAERTQGQARVVLEKGGTIHLDGWSLTELHNTANFTSRLQLGGWLANGHDAQPHSGNNHLQEADLPGRYADIAIRDARVRVEVTHVGAAYPFVKIVWDHKDDQAEGPKDSALLK